MPTRNYEGKRYEGKSEFKTLDALTVEEALQININGKPFTVSMRTPGDDISLVRGMLHSEGIIKNVNFNFDVFLKKENERGIVTNVDLTIPEEELGEGYSNSRSLLSVSSCGICGRTELGDLNFIGDTNKEDDKIDNELLNSLFKKMKKKQVNFHQSGGTHAAAAFTKEGKLLITKEDIGRHNAVDKVIGDLIIINQLKKASILTVSGRISYEIIIKCFKANIPFIAAVSAPSSLAVDYAKEFGITLFGFCRNGRITCYSNQQRVKLKEPNNSSEEEIENKAS